MTPVEALRDALRRDDLDRVELLLRTAERFRVQAELTIIFHVVDLRGVQALGGSTEQVTFTFDGERIPLTPDQLEHVSEVLRPQWHGVVDAVIIPADVRRLFSDHTDTTNPEHTP